MLEGTWGGSGGTRPDSHFFEIPWSRETKGEESALVERVTIREPNDYWRSKLRGLAERYVERPDDLKFGDFTVDTEAQAPEQSANEVLEKIGW